MAEASGRSWRAAAGSSAFTSPGAAFRDNLIQYVPTDASHQSRDADRALITVSPNAAVCPMAGAASSNGRSRDAGLSDRFRLIHIAPRLFRRRAMLLITPPAPVLWLDRPGGFGRHRWGFALSWNEKVSLSSVAGRRFTRTMPPFARCPTRHFLARRLLMCSWMIRASGPRAEQRVIALLGEPTARACVQLDRHIAVGEAVLRGCRMN